MNQKYINSFRRFLGLGFLFCIISLFSSCYNELKNESSNKDSLRERFVNALNEDGNYYILKLAEKTIKLHKEYAKEKLNDRWENGKIALHDSYKINSTETILLEYYNYVVEGNKVEKKEKKTKLVPGTQGIIDHLFDLYKYAYDSGLKALEFYELAVKALDSADKALKANKEDPNSSITLTKGFTYKNVAYSISSGKIDIVINTARDFFRDFKKDVNILNSLCRNLLKSGGTTGGATDEEETDEEETDEEEVGAFKEMFEFPLDVNTRLNNDVVSQEIINDLEKTYEKFEKRADDLFSKEPANATVEGNPASDNGNGNGNGTDEVSNISRR